MFQNYSEIFNLLARLFFQCLKCYGRVNLFAAIFTLSTRNKWACFCCYWLFMFSWLNREPCFQTRVGCWWMWALTLFQLISVHMAFPFVFKDYFNLLQKQALVRLDQIQNYRMNASCGTQKVYWRGLTLSCFGTNILCFQK